MDSNPTTLTPHDAGYPDILMHIPDAPQRLYVRGNTDLLSRQPMLAVVGSRNANAYGKYCMTHIIQPVVRKGVPLVSGLAFGIDAMAHQLCVKHNVPTVAVLGTGIDDATIYPRSHLKLAHEIIEKGGAVISEYEPGTPGNKHRFPERNRIIAGLTKATCVVQASVRSGSLITARLALQYNRDVLAVPGPIDNSLSKGTNSLIQQGAAAIVSAEDIIHALDIDAAELQFSGQQSDALPKPQQAIVKLLSGTPMSFSSIAASVSMPAHELSATLTELELLDVIKHVGGNAYIKNI